MLCAIDTIQKLNSITTIRTNLYALQLHVMGYAKESLLFFFYGLHLIERDDL